MSRRVFIYANEGVSSRVLLHHDDPQHIRVYVWASRPDLFTHDKLADQWMTREVVPMLPQNRKTACTLFENGPGYIKTPLHVPAISDDSDGTQNKT